MCNSYRLSWLAALLGLVLCVPAIAGEVVLENSRLRAVMGEDAVWRSLVDKQTGEDYCAAGKRIAFAAARVAERTREANRASLQGDRLTVGFAGCDTQLTYAVSTSGGWIAWRLVGVSGTRPSHVTLVRVATSLTERVGSRLSAVWNDRYSVCLMGVNLPTQARARRGTGYAELTATTQDSPGPKLEGAAAALIGAPTPELRRILRRLSETYDLPRNQGDGVPSKDLPIARGSYFFLSFGEKEVDKVIDYCRRTGFRQVMMGSGSWCSSVGHYTFNKRRYPDGLASLRRTVARLHEHGILVGMHCFASKISKHDAYVSPVPDRRFWVDRTATLAADIGQGDTAVPTTDDLSHWPGSPAAAQKTWEGGVVKHQEVIIDDEILRYESIGPQGKWDTLLGCQRGSWNTRAAAHQAGTSCRHYGVDGCINGYIVDQETSLLEETTSRLAHVFNTCDFDMVYFDGGEDVDRRRFTHYVSKFQATAMGKFRKRPLVHMGTIMTHNLWHSFTRSGTVDTYLNTLRGRILAGGTWDELPTVKEHIDGSVRYMQSVGDDMMPGELGWFGIWPKGRDSDGLQFDEIEYLMCKSLGHNAPISLQTSFAAMQSHPLCPEILEIVRRYEQLRMAGTVPQATLARLREPGKDFLLFAGQRQKEDVPAEFIRVEALPQVAGTHDVRAMVGPRGSDTIATVWHYVGKAGRLILDTDRVTVFDVAGYAVKAEKVAGRVAIPLGSRRMTLLLTGLTPDKVRELLASARFEPRKPAVTWLRADGEAGPRFCHQRNFVTPGMATDGVSIGPQA